MNNLIQYYLETLPSWVLPIGVPGFLLVVVVSAVLIPFRYLQYVLLAIMPLSLLSNQFLELKSLHAVAKVLFPLAYLALLGVLLMQPAKRKVPPVAWGFVLVGLLGALFVSQCVDALLQVYMGFAYALMAVTAVVLVSRTNSQEDLQRVCLSLYVGFVISTGFMALAILLDNNVMFHLGLYRFSPWGTNPNMLTAHPMIAMLGSFYLVTTPCRTHWKAIALCVAAMALAELLLTGSRSFVLIALPTVPCFAIRFLKRPIIVAAGIIVGVVIVGYLAGKTEKGIQVGRLGSVETTRWEIAAGYLAEIKNRPIFGVFERPGLHSIMVPTVDTHSHNTWILLLHRGGVVYAGYYTLLAVISIWAAVRVLWARRRLGVDPLLVSLLATLLIANYAHGIVNFTNVWATNMWAFLQVTLSALMLSWSRQLHDRTNQNSAVMTRRYVAPMADAPVAHTV